MTRSSAGSDPLRVRFGEFELDEANALLLRDGRAVTLAPTPINLLCALARHPGALLTKHALLDAVWGHRYVSDSVLKTAISDLRTVLTDDPRQPRYIETVARRGYRFTTRLHAGMHGLIVGALLLVTTTAFSEKPPSTSLEQTDELIDLYCASVDPEMRAHCLADIIDPLKDAANVRRLTLLAKALRTLRDWTDDEPELTDDLRRREQNAYRAILRLDPGHSEAMYFLAVSHEDEEDQNTLLRELLSVNPGDAAASRVLAMNLQRNGNVDDAREAFHVLRMAYKKADSNSKVRILLAAEAASALARVDKKASAEFRQSVKKESGVVSILARAAATVKSGAPISEKIAAAKVVIDEFCLEPYLLFDTEACHHGIGLMLQLEESTPRDPRILQALIDGMQGLNKPNFGSAHNYDEELRDRIERLIDVEGPSVALLSDYAAVLKGEEQITVLQSIVAADQTSSAKIHAMLGRALINAGRNVEGIDQLRTAFERAIGRDRYLYGAELVQALRFYGMPQDVMEANQIERILQQS